MPLLPKCYTTTPAEGPKVRSRRKIKIYWLAFVGWCLSNPTPLYANRDTAASSKCAQFIGFVTPEETVNTAALAILLEVDEPMIQELMGVGQATTLLNEMYRAVLQKIDQLRVSCKYSDLCLLPEITGALRKEIPNLLMLRRQKQHDAEFKQISLIYFYGTDTPVPHRSVKTDPPRYPRFREWLARQMALRGIVTFQELAVQVSMNVTLISQYNRGHKVPGQSALARFSAFFGIPVNDLIRSISLPDVSG